MTLYAARPTKVPTNPSAALIESARQRGVTALECEECGHRHPLTRLGYGCNAAHPTQDGETCEGWTLREVSA